MLRSITKVVVFLFMVVSCFSNDLPSDFPKCYLDDPKLKECMLDAFDKMRDRASLGINEIGLPPLKKFVTEVSMKQNTAVADYTFKSTDYAMEGLDNYKMKEFTYDPETMKVHGRFELDKILLSGNCTFEGSIVAIPWHGSGNYKASFGPIDATFEIKGQMRQENGIDYYDPKDVTLTMTIDDCTCVLGGFFGNNKLLNDLTNRMIKASSKIFAKAVTPGLSNAAEGALRRFVENLTKDLPYNKILPRSH